MTAEAELYQAITWGIIYDSHIRFGQIRTELDLSLLLILRYPVAE
jgi:hypothetical protein